MAIELNSCQEDRGWMAVWGAWRRDGSFKRLREKPIKTSWGGLSCLGHSQGRNKVQVLVLSILTTVHSLTLSVGFLWKRTGPDSGDVLGVPDIVRPQRCLEESSGTLSPGPPSHWLRTDIAEQPVCLPVFAGEGKGYAEGRELGRGVMFWAQPLAWQLVLTTLSTGTRA